MQYQRCSFRFLLCSDKISQNLSVSAEMGAKRKSPDILAEPLAVWIEQQPRKENNSKTPWIRHTGKRLCPSKKWSVKKHASGSGALPRDGEDPRQWTMTETRGPNFLLFFLLLQVVLQTHRGAFAIKSIRVPPAVAVDGTQIPICFVGRQAVLSAARCLDTCTLGQELPFTR